MLKAIGSRQDGGQGPVVEKIAGAIALVILGLLIYSNTLGVPFHFDDWSFIISNEALRDPGGLLSLGKGVLGHSSRFLTFATFAANYHFHQLDSGAYRLTNIFIHLISTFLVWRLSFLVFTLAQPRTEDLAKAKQRLCLLTAFLFLVHPAQTQAVTYISQRFSSLATLFYLLCVCLYLTGRVFRGRVAVRALIFCGAILAGLSSMFSKENTITLPLMIIFCEAFFFQTLYNRERWIVNVKALALLVPVLLTGLVIPWMFSFKVREIFSSAVVSQSHLGDIFTFPTYFLTQMRVFVSLLRLFIFPFYQNLYYDYPMSRHWWEPATLLSFLLLLGLLILAFRIRRSHTLISFGLFWFFITLLSELVPRAHVIWEHKLYLPSFGLCLALVAFAATVLRDPRVFRFVLVGVVVLWSVLTFQRNGVWRDELTLWRDVVQKSPGLPIARYNYGRELLKRGVTEEGLLNLNEAIRQDPGYVAAYTCRGIVFSMKGDSRAALRDFEKSMALDPNFAEAYLNRAAVRISLQDYQGALNDFDKALALRPRQTKIYQMYFAEVYLKRAAVQVSLQDYQGALIDFDKAAVFQSRNIEVYKKRGVLKFRMGDYHGAVADYDKVIALNPRDGDAYFQRGYYKDTLKDASGALSDLRKAAELGVAEAKRLLRRAGVFDGD